MANRERVMELVFSYIAMLKEHGVRDYTGKEMQAMRQVSYNWQSPGQGMRYAAAVAEAMRHYNNPVSSMLIEKAHDPADIPCKSLMATPLTCWTIRPMLRGKGFSIPR
jgi:secreted Zn-dependent insulinase-like peptidase